MSSSINPKSFVLGAAVSLTAAFLVQKLQNGGFLTSRRDGACVDDQEGGGRRDASIINGNSYDNDASKKKSQSSVMMDSPDLDLRLIRKAEAVIRARTSSITIVVERCVNDHNYSAIIRTAEALGIQYVWLIDPPVVKDGEEKLLGEDDDDANRGTALSISGKPLRLTSEEIAQRQKHRLFAQNATEWITIRHFQTTAECIDACRETGHQIWVTDLSQKAVPLVPEELESSGNWPLPPKLAIVMGTEAVGCSQHMLESADLRIYLPLRGWADSLNLSVATALIIHHVFMLEPTYVGRMSEDERVELRKLWFPKLARQRLLGSRDKKARKKILREIQHCERIQAKQASGHKLTAEQQEKLNALANQQEALRALEESANYNGATVDHAVADLVRSPPEPLSDLRRADLHRVSFVGRNTKSSNAEHWQDIPTVTGGKTAPMSTASFFRDRVAASSAGDK